MQESRGTSNGPTHSNRVHPGNLLLPRPIGVGQMSDTVTIIFDFIAITSSVVAMAFSLLTRRLLRKDQEQEQEHKQRWNDRLTK